jgi:hypothetical protein
MEESEIAIALPDSNDNLFRSDSGLLPPALFLSANVGFIHLDSTVKHRALCLFHGSPNPVAEIPRCFVRTFIQSPDCALELHGAHAFLGFDQQEHSGKPCGQGQVGIVEHCASENGEVIFALGTIELPVSLYPRDTFAVATRAFDAVRPSQFDQNLSAFIIGIEKVLNVKECHG